MKILRPVFLVYLILNIIFFAEEYASGATPKPENTVNVASFAELFKPFEPSSLYQLYDDFPEKKPELDSYFRVLKKHHLKPGNQKKVISYSLFWKRAHIEWGVPIVSRDTIHEGNSNFLHGKSFYERYLSPLLRSIEQTPSLYPGWIVRIHLSNDLAFLIEDYFNSYDNVEVFLMESNSIAHNPGSMWRFLAFDDPDVSMVLVRDSDDMLDSNKESYIRKWIQNPTSKGFCRWHTPYLYSLELENIGYLLYSPLLTNLVGGKNMDQYIQMEKAMKGFILHRNLFPDEPRHPKDIAVDGHPYGFGNLFPNYGLDERFLKHVIYFLMADKGLLTTFPTNNFLPKDVCKNLSDWNPVLADYNYIHIHRVNSQQNSSGGLRR